MPKAQAGAIYTAIAEAKLTPGLSSIVNVNTLKPGRTFFHHRDKISRKQLNTLVKAIAMTLRHTICDVLSNIAQYVTPSPKLIRTIFVI